MINFSKYKLQLTEGLATSTGTASSLDASQKSSGNSVQGADTAQTQKQMGNERLRRQRAQKADPRGAGQVFEDLRKQKEIINSYEAQKSDWRSELQEKVVDGQERQQHPYVTVMPTGDENLLQAVEQMAKTAKKKKDSVTEETEQLDELAPLIGAVAGKAAAAGASKLATAGAAKAGGTIAKAASSRIGQAAINAGANKVGDKVEKKISEETEDLEEAKKKCKDGYKYDSKKKKCVKKKSSTKKSKTTIIVGRGWGYGGGHHHHDNDNDENDNGGGGDTGGSSGEGGGMSEMFDVLGDMMINELQEKSRMEKMAAEYKSALAKPSKFANMTPDDKKKMTKAVGKPRMGSSD